MALRPNFDKVELDGSRLVVTGQSDDDPLPVEVQVFIEQDGEVERGSVDKLTTGWTVTLDATSFQKGAALGFGVEIRTLPFETSSWTQIVEIE